MLDCGWFKIISVDTWATKVSIRHTSGGATRCRHDRTPRRSFDSGRHGCLLGLTERFVRADLHRYLSRAAAPEHCATRFNPRGSTLPDVARKQEQSLKILPGDLLAIYMVGSSARVTRYFNLKSADYSNLNHGEEIIINVLANSFRFI